MATDDHNKTNADRLPDVSEDEPYRILDDDGSLVPGATVPDLSDDELLSMYRDLKRARMVDEKMLSLQKQGRISTYAPMAGHEAAQIGSMYALEDRDMVFPTYRDNGSMVQRIGVTNLIRQLSGREEGYTDEDENMFPPAIPIASQIPHATGWAWAAKLKGEDAVSLAYFGDGATSEGDFHEGLNMAGVFDTPTVFFCENNQYAISVPLERQTASDTIAQKAVAYGFDGVRVDGMDPLAVYAVTHDAVEHARNPQYDDLRPTLIEAELYRFGPHTTSDDPRLYRRQEEEGEWNEKDPVPRMETFLRNSDILTDGLYDEMVAEIEQELEDAMEIVDSEPASDPEEMFMHVYDEMTPALEEQRRYLEEREE